MGLHRVNPAAHKADVERRRAEAARAMADSDRRALEIALRRKPLGMHDHIPGGSTPEEWPA